MVIMDDLEWPMLSYYVIYYEKFRKVMQQTEKEALSRLLRQGSRADIISQITYSEL